MSLHQLLANKRRPSIPRNISQILQIGKSQQWDIRDELKREIQSQLLNDQSNNINSYQTTFDKVIQFI